MDDSEFRRREQQALQTAHTGLCAAIAMIPGRSEWLPSFWALAAVLGHELGQVSVFAETTPGEAAA